MTSGFALIVLLRRTVATAIAWTVVACVWSSLALAQFDPRILESHSVRVTTTHNGKSKIASGFLWLKNDQVVTSLHAVALGAISVECRGLTQTATVERVLQKADLALLKTERPFGGYCSPFMDDVEQPPAVGTRLHTFGFFNGGVGTTRHFSREYAVNDTLEYLLTGDPLSMLKKGGMPSTSLHIYYVQGGLLPGYSGGPVVNDAGQLVAIVDGGLDHGMSEYNWVIPAGQLRQLLTSTTKEVSEDVAEASWLLFAAPPVENHPDQQHSSPTILEFEEHGWHYRYVYTKTRSLAELAKSSDDPEGVKSLFKIYGPAVGKYADDRMRFDIFKDEERGLIIAVPEGKELTFDQDEKSAWLRSHGDFEGDEDDVQISPFSGDYAQFEELHFLDANGRPLPDEYGVEASNGTGRAVASDPRFFNEMIASILADCNIPGNSTCGLDPATLRIIDFGNGNKILKVGLRVHYLDPSDLDKYDYYSVAVRGKAVFLSLGEIWIAQDDEGLINCLAHPNASGCSNPHDAIEQLSQLVAVHLTTFADLNKEARKPELETRFVYDQSADDPQTLRAQYYEGNVLRFYNRRGKLWDESLDGYNELFRTVKIEGGYVYLQQGTINHYVRFPISGGTYEQSDDRGQTWHAVGLLVRK